MNTQHSRAIAFAPLAFGLAAIALVQSADPVMAAQDELVPASTWPAQPPTPEPEPLQLPASQLSAPQGQAPQLTAPQDPRTFAGTIVNTFPATAGHPGSLAVGGSSTASQDAQALQELHRLRREIEILRAERETMLRTLEQSELQRPFTRARSSTSEPSVQIATQAEGDTLRRASVVPPVSTLEAEAELSPPEFPEWSARFEEQSEPCELEAQFTQAEKIADPFQPERSVREAQLTDFELQRNELAPPPFPTSLDPEHVARLRAESLRAQERELQELQRALAEQARALEHDPFRQSVHELEREFQRVRLNRAGEQHEPLPPTAAQRKLELQVERLHNDIAVFRRAQERTVQADPFQFSDAPVDQLHAEHGLRSPHPARSNSMPSGDDVPLSASPNSGHRSAPRPILNPPPAPNVAPVHPRSSNSIEDVETQVPHHDDAGEKPAHDEMLDLLHEIRDELRLMRGEMRELRSSVQSEGRVGAARRQGGEPVPFEAETAHTGVTPEPTVFKQLKQLKQLEQLEQLEHLELIELLELASRAY